MPSKRPPPLPGGYPIGFLDGDTAHPLNMHGNYDYMTTGYYTSQDLEMQGLQVRPTCKEALDAYTVPVFLEKAKLASLPIPSYYITNGYFEPPVVADAINPFMDREAVILRAGHQERLGKSITRNYTYAMCCQDLPPGAKVTDFRLVLGWTTSPRFRDLAQAVWQVFHVPLAEVRVIMTAQGEALLSAMRPLPLRQLSPKEWQQVEKRLSWQTSGSLSSATP